MASKKFILIDSEWYKFEGKIQNNSKSFQIIFLRFRTICIFFYFKKKKTYLVVDDRGLGPGGGGSTPFTDMTATLRFFTPSL